MIRNLFTATSGLQGHQTLLDVVGNNLANVNTTAFKAERLRFSDQFSDVLRAHTGPTGAIGGTNPNQVGQGVKVAAIDSIMVQGALETTGNNLDLAIQDEGFFVVRNGNQDFFTRAGAFSIDGDGRLVDSATGYRLQRAGIVGEPSVTTPGFQVATDNGINIPLGAAIEGVRTANVTLAGNLDAEAIGPLQEQIQINTPLTTNNGTPATTAADLNDLDQLQNPGAGDFVDGDLVQITGTLPGGQDVSGTFVYTAAGDNTVGELIRVINDIFGGNDGAAGTESPNGATATLVNGIIQLTANQPGVADLTMNLSTSDGDTTGVLELNNFVLVTDGKEGDQTTSSIEIFDDQGTSHTLTQTFEKQANNEWDLSVSIDPSGSFDGLDARVDGITFNENGSFQSVAGVDTNQILSTSLPLTFAATGTTSTRAAAGTDTLSDLVQSSGTYDATDAIRVDWTRPDGTSSSTVIGAAAAGAVAPFVLDLSAGTSTLTAIVALLNNAAIFGGPTATGGAEVRLSDNGQLVVTANAVGVSQTSLTLTSIVGTPATPSGSTAFDSFIEVQQGTEGHDGDDDIQVEINNLSGFNTPQTIEIGLGTVGAFDGLTQFGGFTSAAATEQDGSAAGNLIDVAVQSDGIVNGLFDNGRTIGLAQLAVASFTNPSGLDRVASNYFSDNTNSGTAVIGIAGSGGRGTIQSGVLENSNVDVTVEFTRLITAQRGFQVNARSFSTANSVLDETVNLVR